MSLATVIPEADFDIYEGIVSVLEECLLDEEGYPPLRTPTSRIDAPPHSEARIQLMIERVERWEVPISKADADLPDKIGKRGRTYINNAQAPGILVMQDADGLHQIEDPRPVTKELAAEDVENMKPADVISKIQSLQHRLGAIRNECIECHFYGASRLATLIASVLAVCKSIHAQNTAIVECGPCKGQGCPCCLSKIPKRLKTTVPKSTSRKILRMPEPEPMLFQMCS